MSWDGPVRTSIGRCQNFSRKADYDTVVSVYKRDPYNICKLPLV